MAVRSAVGMFPKINNVSNHLLLCLCLRIGFDDRPSFRRKLQNNQNTASYNRFRRLAWAFVRQWLATNSCRSQSQQFNQARLLQGNWHGQFHSFGIKEHKFVQSQTNFPHLNMVVYLQLLDFFLYLQDGIVNNPEFRRVPLGASHAFGTARDFAKLYGVLSSGGKYNSRLVCIDGNQLEIWHKTMLIHRGTFGGKVG